MSASEHRAYGEGRIGRSWRLTAEAWRVVRRDRSALTLALAQIAAAVAVAAAIFVISGYAAHPQHAGRVALAGLIAYWPATFLGTFLGVALAAAVAGAMRGEPLTLSQALGVARGRLGQIVLWSLLATGVGILIQEIAARVPWGGRIAGWLLGTAWSLATLFAIPVLALEGCTATGCVKRSGELLKRRWGEGVAGVVTIAAWTFLAIVPLAVAVGVATAFVSYGVALAIEMCAIVLIVSVAATARSVFAVALYRYAVAGEAEAFDERDLARPFTKKKGFWRS